MRRDFLPGGLPVRYLGTRLRSQAPSRGIDETPRWVGCLPWCIGFGAVLRSRGPGWNLRAAPRECRCDTGAVRGSGDGVLTTGFSISPRLILPSKQPGEFRVCGAGRPALPRPAGSPPRVAEGRAQCHPWQEGWHRLGDRRVPRILPHLYVRPLSRVKCPPATDLTQAVAEG